LNKARRSRLATILETSEELSAALQEVIEEEEAAYENLPKSIQGSDRGERASGTIEILNEALELFEQAKDCIQEGSE
jgi:hypothetical protein